MLRISLLCLALAGCGFYPDANYRCLEREVLSGVCTKAEYWCVPPRELRYNGQQPICVAPEHLQIKS